jgi:hypothetical protein
MAPELVNLPDEGREQVAAQARRLGPAALVRAMEVVGAALVDMRDALDSRICLEVALVRLARPDTDVSPEALLARLERLERQVASGSGPAASASPATSASPAASGAPAASSISAAGERGPLSTTASGVGPSSPTAAGATAAGPSAARPSASAPGADLRPPTAGGPASEARQALGAIKSRQSQSPARPSSDRPPEPPRSVNRPPASTSGAQGVAGPAPSRDELVKAWGDTVLAGLSGRARSRYGVGRFLDASDGSATFAVPNEIHRGRSEECREEVEQALSAHFASPVRLRLVVDSTEAAVLSDGSGPAGGEPPQDEELIDMSELRPAHDAASSPEERVRQAFPGAREVDK